jgi:hypothetical protein
VSCYSNMKRERSSDDSHKGDPPDEKQQPKKYITSKGKGRAPDRELPQLEPDPVESGGAIGQAIESAFVGETVPSVQEALPFLDVEEALPYLDVGESAEGSAHVARLVAVSAKCNSEYVAFVVKTASGRAGVAEKDAEAARTEALRASLDAGFIESDNEDAFLNHRWAMHEFQVAMANNNVHLQVAAVPAPNIDLGVTEAAYQGERWGLDEDPKFLDGEEVGGGVGDLPERLGEPLQLPLAESPLKSPEPPRGSLGSSPESAKTSVDSSAKTSVDPGRN